MASFFQRKPAWLGFSFILLIFLPSQLQAQQSATTSALLLQAQQQMQAYDYAEAIPLLRQVIENDSLSILPQWLISQSYAQLGQTAAAKHQLERLLTRAPEHIPARALLAQLYLKETNYKNAAAAYDVLISLDSLNTYFLKQRAFIADKAEDASGAIGFYQMALHLSPQDTESLTELADLWLRMHKPEMAVPLLARGLAQDSSNLRLWRLQAKLSYTQKDYLQVVKAMKRPLQAGDSARYYVQLLGISYFHLGKYPEAIQWLEYLEQQGVDAEVLYYYLGLSYRNSGDKAIGIQYLERAAQKAVSENLSHYHTQLAISYEEKGDYGNAIRSYQLAYKGSGDKKLLYHLARNYDQHYKDKRVALRYYQKYLTEVDTANTNYQDYARYRTSQLKEHMHFSLDSI